MTDAKTQAFEEFKAFIDEFGSETDRAIVVLTAARLDFLLLSLLQKRLIANSSRSDEFFENQEPGSSFSNKIMLTFRMGIIDAEFARALHLVRTIRNDFAHETHACSLDKGSHKDRVRSLTAPYLKYDIFIKFKKLYFEKSAPSRADYMTIVGIMILRLQYICEAIDPINASIALPVFTDAMKKAIEPAKQITEGS